MRQRVTCLAIWLLLLCAFAAPSPQFSLAAEEPLAAQALSITPEAWVERGGQKIPLQQKNKVYRSDVVLTGPTGRAQLLFEDDTVISMGADSSVAIADFSFGAGKKPNFAANMAKGTARFVTGQIVKQNQEGFNVSTPNATIGIRGTTVFIQLSADAEKFIVEAIQPGNTVQIKDSHGGLHTLTSAGQGLILNAGGATPITIEGGGLLSNNKATGGESKQSGGSGEDETLKNLVAEASPAGLWELQQKNFLDANQSLPLVEQKIFYSGDITSIGVGGVIQGNFSFSGELFSGGISDASFFASDNGQNVFNAVNGSGRIGGDMHYTIGDFTILVRGLPGGGVYPNATGLIMEGDIIDMTSTSGSYTVVNSMDYGTYQSK